MIFRPFKSIVIDDFAKDLASLPHITCPASTSEGLLKQYNDGVRSTLEKHAPLQTKVCVIRSSSSWLNEDIKVARRTRRMAERRWRKNPIVVHRQMLSSARNRLSDLMESAKSSHLKGLIAVRDSTVGASWFLREINEYKCAWSNVFIEQNSRIETTIGRETQDR